MNGGETLIRLTRAERDDIANRARRSKCNGKIYRRLMIVLLTDDGNSVVEICAAVGASSTTVNRWRSVFLRWGIDGVLKPRRRDRGQQTDSPS